MKYIDADRLLAEIEKILSEIIAKALNPYADIERVASAKYKKDALSDAISIIDSLQQDPRFPLYDNIVEKVFGAGNLEGWERDEAEMLVVLAKEELLKSLQQEQPVNMIQWTGSNLQEVINFTGKSPKFGEWFKSWDEFESYVHSHGDILKLFSDDGSHFEVPVGAWIVKTPDGYNVPSVARFIHVKQQHPQLPGIEDPGIPGKDFIPVEWVDACEMYGKWKIVKLDQPEGGCSEKPNDLLREQPEVDLEKEAVSFCFDNGINISPRQAKNIASHFYELGRARKESEI